MPFTYVSWDALQSMVIGGGVTFAVQAVEIGANQVPLPIGNAVLVTCGPFECMEGPAPPEISIANSGACSEWDPTVDIQVGKIDNDGWRRHRRHRERRRDLGMVISSSLALKVKHSWSGVANGRNTSTTVDVGRSSSGATVAMKAVEGIVMVDTDTNDDETISDDERACDNTYDGGRPHRPAEGLLPPAGPGSRRRRRRLSRGLRHRTAAAGRGGELGPGGLGEPIRSRT